MSDQGGARAGWHPDPDGRHEFRYWDGSAWTDQVSDGGVTSTDPPGPAPAAPEASPAPPAEKPKKKVPVGILALIGVVVAAAVAGGVILLAGGDDGGDDAGGGGSGGGEEGAEGELSGSISEDEPFVVRTFDLEAGEAIRVRVEPEDEDLELRLTIAAEPDLAMTELFGFDGDDDDLLESWGENFDHLLSDTIESELSTDLSQSLTEDFSDYQEELAEGVPSLEDVGVPIYTNTSGGEGEPKHAIFMAPLAGRYSVVVGGADSEGDFEGEVSTAGPSDEFEGQDPDEEFDPEEYYEGIEPLREEICEEEFWQGDLSDLSLGTGDVCDDANFESLIEEGYTGYFTDDSSDDFSSDFSDEFTSDFSDDFSSDLSDDFSSDFSDDASDDLAVFDPVPPADGIDNWGARPHLDPLAEFCFDGDLIACDDLYELSPSGLVGSYRDYGRTCGLRVTISLAGRCEARLG